MSNSLDRPSGFTLIELLAIVMIMGILLMAGVPALTSVLSDSKLSSASRIMVSAIETTVSLSIQYQRPFQFEADTSANTFQIRDMAPYPDDTAGTIRIGNLPPVNGDDIVFNSLQGTWYIVDFAATGNFKGVLIDSGPAALTFFPDGHSAYGDSQYVLSLGELSRTITINGISGRITVD